MINKKRNVLIQITLDKKDYEKLLIIQNQLNDYVGFTFNKSQAITYLIRNFGEKAKTNAVSKEQKGEYQFLLQTLKTETNKSNKELAELVGISLSTLKHYIAGRNEPKGNNKELIDEALKKYGIL